MIPQWEIFVVLGYSSILIFQLAPLSSARNNSRAFDFDLFRPTLVRRPPIVIERNYTPTFYSRRRPTGCKCGRKPFSDGLFPIFNFNYREYDQTIAQPLIVGGTKAEVYEFPWMVAIADISIPRQRISCGGALINSHYVLTAAHCVQHKFRSWTELWFNAHDMDKAEKYSDRNVLRRKVKRFIMHPRYPSLSREHDIALIELNEPIDFTKTSIRPVCLPTSNAYDFAGQLGTVAGWGYNGSYSGVRTNELHKLTIPILSHEDCTRTLHFNSVKPNMMCAGELAGGKDACYSDSGGPLIVQMGNRNVVAGIVAWGRGCGRRNLPGVYTRVSSYLKWINAAARKGDWCQRQNNKIIQYFQF